MSHPAEPNTLSDFKNLKNIYFMGIAGTGMAAAAGLCHKAGYKISGSDQKVFPPMSDLLADLGIEVKQPYKANQFEGESPDVVVVANALSRGHAELESALDKGVPVTSFAELVGHLFLEKPSSVVVSGTHGKTTTSSLISHMLRELNADPGYLIGGLPQGFDQGFALGSGKFFVIEGDEYDTAFWDKNSKFLHYRPDYLVINNLEFDHVDIFSSIEDIYRQFTMLIEQVPDASKIFVHPLPVVKELIKRLKLEDKVTWVDQQCEVLNVDYDSHGTTLEVNLKGFGRVSLKTTLIGEHSIQNIQMMSAVLHKMVESGELPAFTIQAFQEALQSFGGVKRRMDHLASKNGIDVFEDFAHHPTAIKSVINGFRMRYPTKRLWVAFEPKNATSRRNFFIKEFASSLTLADRVLIGECAQDLRIPEEERMSTKQLSDLIGEHSKSFDSNELLYDHVADKLKKGDAIIFMTPGSFSGVQHKLKKFLENLD